MYNIKFNPVRESCRQVAGLCRNVRINQTKLKEFSERLRSEPIMHWTFQSPVQLSGLSDREMITLLFVFNAISFNSWGTPKWKVEYHGVEGERGTWSMLLAIKRATNKGKEVTDQIKKFNFPVTATFEGAFEGWDANRSIENGYSSHILDPYFLAAIKPEQLGKILKGKDGAEIPLLDERTKILNMLGRRIISECNGDLGNIIDVSGRDVMSFVHLVLQTFPFFHDQALFRTVQVFFHKKIQLLAADLNNTFNMFDNMEMLTGCADYILPMVLRYFGVLEYSRELAGKVDSGIEIPKDHLDELEIRICTIEAIELLRKLIPEINSMQINDILWLMKSQLPNKMQHHLVRRIEY